VELEDERTFILHGRSADMVNIAGKRTSLAYLNHQLNSIEGVRDGVFFMPEDAADAVVRPLAFAVAPGLSREDLVKALRERIDAVFLPRPLHLVEALPRNATGKLQREALRQLARAQSAPSSPPRPETEVIVVRSPVPAAHPAAPGHFPGNPIMPGVVLLDEIIAAAVLHGRFANAACVVKAAKFLRAVRPGEELTIRLLSQARGVVRFECSVDGQMAVSGSLQAGTGGGRV
jgi:3-hydroxymyristoyl/3-hydroxydecanoyl-(acyl carrier protein) dehydratase